MTWRRASQCSRRGSHGEDRAGGYDSPQPSRKGPGQQRTARQPPATSDRGRPPGHGPGARRDTRPRTSRSEQRAGDAGGGPKYNRRRDAREKKRFQPPPPPMRLDAGGAN